MQVFQRIAAATLVLAMPFATSAQPMIVSAAASLTNAFKDIAGRFEAAHPGAQVQLNFAASGTLLQQMAQGAPVDVFASADQATMDRAAAQNLIDAASRRDFVTNSLVLIAPVEADAGISSLAELGSDAIQRIAVGKVESVPAGRYTQEVLQAESLWTSLQSKFIPADSVRQVLDYVARGEVDAGFVYATDAAVMGDAVRVVLVAEGHKPVTYPAAVAADSRHRTLAGEFIDFLFTDEAQTVLGQYGFGTP